jgi:hypothetical protein
MKYPSTPSSNVSDAVPQYWHVAVKCRKEGTPAISAIQQVWDAMPPPAPLPDLAVVIGATYADSYWATTQMDPTRLANDMVAAQGWNFNDCYRAAQFAFSKWCGLFLRGNFSNAGAIPKNDPLSDSPDVLLNGAGPLTPTQMLRQWNSRFYNSAPGTKNYAYGRSASVALPVPIDNAQLRMYSTDGGFNLPPQSWTQLYTFDGNNTTSVMQGMEPGPVEPGGRCANAKPFQFTPPGSGHYCLIATASTEFFENNPLTSTGNWNSSTWLACNGAAGWHNINVAQGSSATLKFANQDGRAERFAFEAHCAHLPPGTVVSLSAAGQRLASSIESGPVTVMQPYRSVATEGVVPPNYLGELVVGFKTPDGKPLPATAWIEVRMLWLLEAGHPHHGDALARLGAPGGAGSVARLQVPMGNFTLVGSA